MDNDSQIEEDDESQEQMPKVAENDLTKTHMPNKMLH